MDKNERLIIRTGDKSVQWNDPWGQKHNVDLLLDMAVIHRTDQQVGFHNGYTDEMVWVWKDNEGRRWIAIPPYDYAGTTYYRPIAMHPKDNVTERSWYEYSPYKRMMLANGTPVTSAEQILNLMGEQ